MGCVLYEVVRVLQAGIDNAHSLGYAVNALHHVAAGQDMMMAALAVGDNEALGRLLDRFGLGVFRQRANLDNGDFALCADNLFS